MTEAPETLPTASSQWFRQAMACRWPLTVVLSLWAVSTAVVQLLRQPIPIALPQETAIPIRLVGDLTIDALRQPVRIQSVEKLPVVGDMAVEAKVVIESFDAPIAVSGESGDAISITTPAKQPLAVEGRVGVSDVEGKVNVQLRNAAKSILPIP